MFCPNCGKELEDGALFCGECGAKIEQRQPEPKKKKTVKKTAPKKSVVNQLKEKGGAFSPKAKKIIIAQVVVLVVLVAAFFYLGTRSGKPEAAVNQFVEDYNNKDWEKVYDAYDFDSSENKFLTKDAFVGTMEQSDTETLSAATGGYYRNGEYIYQIKKGSSYITVNVAKSAKKSFFFFDKYEVTNVTDSTVLTQSVTVPNISGVTLKIDGITAENTSSNDDAISYQVVLFKGTHKATFSGADDMFDKNSYTFTTGSNDLTKQIEYSDKAKEEAAKALEGYLPDITENYIKENDKADLESCFSSESKAQIYGNSLCSYTYYRGSDTKNLGDVVVSRCAAVSPTSSYYSAANGIPVSVSGTRSYQAKSFSGSYMPQSCVIRGVAYMVKKDGKWVINSVTYSYY